MVTVFLNIFKLIKGLSIYFCCLFFFCELALNNPIYGQNDFGNGALNNPIYGEGGVNNEEGSSSNGEVLSNMTNGATHLHGRHLNTTKNSDKPNVPLSFPNTAGGGLPAMGYVPPRTRLSPGEAYVEHNHSNNMN